MNLLTTFKTDVFDILTIFPMVIIFFASLLPLIIKSIRQKEQRPIATLLQGLSGIGVAIGWVFLSMEAGNVGAFSDALIIDGSSYPAIIIVLISAAASLIMAHENINVRGDHYSEFVFLILNSVIGMMTLIWANDLLVMFIGIEIMSISLYLLIGMSHEQRLSKEAAFKYFILGGFSAAILLYGLAFIFGVSGTTELLVLKNVSASLMDSNRLFVIGWVLMMAGFCFKTAIFPFHVWTPDVYQGAATPVTAFMATAVKTASFMAFLKFVLFMNFGKSEVIVDLMQWLAVLTILVGNIAAVMQENLKRMLAYSSVAHSGYLFIGVITAGTGGGEGAVSSLVFYLVAYAIMNLGAFAMISLFEKHEDTILHVEDLKGLAHKYPGLALGFTIFLLSLAGIPPTVGFFGKLYLFSTAIAQGYVWLAVWGVIGSVVSVYYYLRPIVTMYMVEGEPRPITSNISAKTIILAASVAVIVIGVVSSPFFKLIQRSVHQLFL
ncbi:MAG: NADH-quinone oxidoreductase subunit N [Bdellovibrionales bacterium]